MNRISRMLLFAAIQSFFSLAAAAQTPFPFDVVTGRCRLLWSIEGDLQFTNIGAVLPVHDANHDGIRDLLVAGRTPGSGATAFRLLSGQNGAKLQSYSIPAGPHIVGSGDFNRDRRTDVVLLSYIAKTIGDPPSSTPGYYRILVADAQSGRILWSRTSPKSQPDFGASIATAADLNGDHIADLLVVSMTRDNNGAATPFVVLLSGKDGATLRRLPAPDGASSFFGAGMATALLDEDATPDYVFTDILYSPSPTRLEAHAWAINGATREILWSRSESSDALFGDTIIGVPDLNSDDAPDFVFASPNDRDAVRGTVQAVSGRTGKQIWIAPGKVLTGQFGRSLIAMPDLTNDGIPEIGAGAPAMLPPILAGGVPGHFQILNGRNGKVLILVKEILPSGMSFTSQFGMHLASPGDLNNDGAQEIVVSAPRFGASESGGITPGLLAVFTIEP